MGLHLSAISGIEKVARLREGIESKKSASGDQNGVLEYNEAQRPADGVPL